MVSRVSFGSIRAFAISVAMVLVLGVLAELDNGSGHLDRVFPLYALVRIAISSASMAIEG